MNRIVRVITRLNIGGPARQALLLTRALADSYDTTLLAGRPKPEEGELGDPEVAVEHVPLIRPISPREDLRALAAVRRVIAERRPAIVHTHMAKAGAVARIAAMSVRPRPRIVHTFHGHVLDGYFSPRAQRAFVHAERALARNTDLLIAVSDEVRRDLLELGITSPNGIRVVPVGLPLRRHQNIAGRSGLLRSELGLDDSEPLIGLVGRLVPIKDPMTALQVVERVPGAHLAIVGGGELETKVADEIAMRGLAQRVHQMGWHHDMPAVLADLDVVLLTSKNEGTPVALIEAAACGLPVVATSVGGVPSVVIDGVTGLLAPPGDVNALADALTRLLSDRALSGAMRTAARARSNLWSEERLVADLRSLYDELLKG